MFSPYTVVLDACVLYPAQLRDLLITLAQTGLFRARWTNQIHEEWIEAVLERRRDLNRAQLERARELMNSAVRDCLVTGYEGLIGGLVLPDAGDRHVLAAAVRAGADAIVTLNLRDFPDEALSPLGIEAVHPDDFVLHQLDLNTPLILGAIREQRLRLKAPPRSVDEFLATLEPILPQTVARLRTHAREP